MDTDNNRLSVETQPQAADEQDGGDEIARELRCKRRLVPAESAFSRGRMSASATQIKPEV